jgi:hypothetical protein
MHRIQLNGVSVQHAGRVVIRGVDLAIGERDRTYPT